jgi:quinol monooxygenase YgiN
LFFFTCKLYAKPENIVEITQTLEGIVEKMKGHEGCKDIRILKDISDDRKLWLVTEWQQQRDLEGSVKSRFFEVLMGSKGLLIEDPDVRYTVEI